MCAAYPLSLNRPLNDGARQKRLKGSSDRQNKGRNRFLRSISSRGLGFQMFAACPLPLNPRPAGVFSRTRPAGGGLILPPPCLTSERRVVERRGKRQTKGLNETDLKSTKNFA